MKKHIPNFLTICNLCSGCLAVRSAFVADYQSVLIFVLISAVFDFLDGFVARLLRAYSPLGKELDSLADVVSFGLAPSMVAVSLLTDSIGNYGYVGMLIVAFSALRLARFNIDDRQTSSFIGMPTPANAILWSGLGFTYHRFLSDNVAITLVLVATTSYLLISSLPMFSLKFKDFGIRSNKWQYILIVSTIILLIALKYSVFVWSIVVYIVLSAIKALVECRCKKSEVDTPSATTDNQ